MQRNFYIPRLIETGKILLLIQLIWMCIPTTVFTQACHFKTGDPVALTASGFTVTAGYQQNYVLTDGAGVIQYISPSLPVNGVGAGQYIAYAVNYNTTGTLPNLTVGVNITAIGGSCVDISAGLPVGVCNCNNSTGTLTFNISGNTIVGGYTQSFALTDDDGTILAISATPSFPGLADGVYNVYSINYETASGISSYSVGNQITALTGMCFDISDPLGFVVCLAACNPVIAASGPTTFCVGGSVTLDAGTGYTAYLWSNGATTRTINVTTSGTYNVTVTGANGCVGSAVSGTVVTVNPNPVPVIIPSGPTTFCAGGAVTLDAGVGYTAYLWSNGATTRTINVTTSGTYNVTVTGANGCVGSAVSGTVVTVNPNPVPVIAASGPTTFCAGGAVTLDAGTGYTAYLWSNGATTRTINVTTSGTYNVTVTGANGCVGSAVSGTVVIVNPNPVPTITAFGPTTFCAGGSVTLDAGAGYTAYLWSNGATTRTINVITSGTYNVTVTGVGGCTGPAASGTTITVTPIAACPCNNTTGNLIFTLSGNTVTNGYTQSFALTNATGLILAISATPAFNGLSNGTYFVYSVNYETATGIGNYAVGNQITTLSGTCFDVSDPLGFVVCLAACNPVIAASGPTTFCAGGAVTLDAGTGYTAYLWSNGATTRTINVTTSGTYNVTVTGANGCVGSAVSGTVVIVNPNPVPTITAFGPTTFCAGGSVTLDAGAGYTAYLWSNGATTRTINVITSGAYNVTVTGVGGCTGPAASGTTITVTPIAACPCNNTTGNLIFTLSGNTVTNGYTQSFALTNATGLILAISATPAFNGLSNGTYFVYSVNYETATGIGNYAVGNQITTLSGTCFDVSDPLGFVVCLAACNPVIAASGPTTFCAGGAVTLDAGTGYTAYLWSNGATTRTINVTTSGTYNVTVTGANGCVGSAVSGTVVTVNPNPVPVITAFGLTTFCAGGSVTLDAGAGYTAYLWSNGATTQAIPVNASGNYNLTVTGTNGCTSTTSIVITAPSQLTATISATTPVACSGGTSGTATVTALGGTSPYTYVWPVSAASQTTATAINLTAGVFIVTVTDAHSCTATASATVGGLSASISATTAVTCLPGSTGTATVVAANGTSPYTYLWPVSAASQTTATATNLPAGTYVATVTDANGCTTTASAIVGGLSASISATKNVSCFGGTTGSATVIAAAGTSPYTYLWSNGQTTAIAINLAAGTYTVTATDVNGCTTTASAIINGPTAALSVNISTSVNVRCFGGATGSVDIVASGGTGAYLYDWSDIPGTNNAEDRLGLAAGIYTVTATDANGCTATTLVTITQPATALSVTIFASTNVACFGGATGIATVAAAGGTPVYTYAWPVSAASQTTAMATNLAAGIYIVTVTDANGCTAIASATVTQPATALTATISATVPAACAGGSGGSATVTVVGGTPTYTYLWPVNAANQTTATAANLTTGIYVVTVTDAYGCTTTATATVGGLMATISATTATTCLPGSTGTATISASGGTSPYSYLWPASAASQTTATATNLPAGTYVATVIDANGCTTTASATVGGLSAVISATSAATCFGGATGSATVVATAGTTPYTYLWPVTAASQTTATATNLPTGTYIVTVTDANGCTATASATITQPVTNVSVVISTQTNVACFGGASGLVTVSTVGGTGVVTYLWSNGQTTATAINLVAAVYTVTATDANGCTATATATITQPAAALTASINATNAAACFGAASGSATVSTVGGTGVVTYLWSNGQTTATAINLTAGNYIVTATDANGCTTTASATITQPATTLTAIISATNAAACFGGASGSATVSSVGGTGVVTYLWSNGQTTAIAINLAAGIYIVTATDANGCTATASTTITQPTAALTATISGTTGTDCTGGATGSATVAAIGGTGVVTYLWSNGQTTATAINLAAGSYILTATDANGCTTTATATVLTNGSSPLFTVTGGGAFCINDPGISVGLSGSALGFNYQLKVGGVNTGLPLAGTGNALNFGLQTTVGTYTVVATTAAGGCTTTMTGAVTISTFGCAISITDPCVCLNNATTLNNGQFGEVIQVNAPSNQVWTVTAVTGLYLTSSPAPPAVPILIPLGTVLANLGNNTFQLTGKHIESVGYNLTVTNQAGVSFSVSNLCSYPNPAITSDLTSNFCVNATPVPLTGTPGDANIVSATFTVNGQPATQFNPAAGPGQYVVTYTVNGGVAAGGDPGCIQSVSQLVNVVATPSQLSCNDFVYLSLDATCTTVITPNMILEGSYGCYGDYLVELDKIAPLGNGPWVPGVVNASDIGKTYQVRITHIPSGNRCWGNLKVEDKLPPVLICPSFTLPCNANIAPGQPGVLLPNGLLLSSACLQQTGVSCFQVPAGCGLPQLDCSNVTLCYIDTDVESSCASGFSRIVTRKWTATDAYGNSSTCIQTISLVRPTLADVVCPPNYDDIQAPHFDCSTLIGYPTPAAIEALGLQGFPYIFGQLSGCNINYGYTDLTIPVCDGSYKIIRTWQILDWCTGEVVECIQIIKVLDTTGPTFVVPADLTVSVNQDGCCAYVDLPDVIITDECSRISGIQAMVATFTSDPAIVPAQQTGMLAFNGTLTNYPGNNLWLPDTLGSFGFTPCLPLGRHTVTYVVTDQCGNTRAQTFNLTILDLEPPVASCDQTTTVAVVNDDPFDCYGPAGPNNVPAAFGPCEFGGVVLIPAKNFDDGSYDNCNNVYFTAQRMNDSPCIAGLNKRNGHPACNDNVRDPISEFELATLENDTIKFYCCEVGTTQTIILRVYQVDANGLAIRDLDGNLIFNSCMVQVEVQDKLKPTCIAPPTAIVDCKSFDQTLWAYGIPQVSDNCCLLSAPNNYVYQGVAQCGLTVANNYSNFDTVCNRGTIRRTFTVTDCHNLSTTCTQNIVVTYNQDYYVAFPDDKIVTVCDGTTDFGKPRFFGEDCELLATTFEDQVYTVVEDACYKIERTWTVINWCTYNPNLPCIDVPNPNPTIINSQANLTGPTVSACNNNIPGWNPTIVRINPTDPTTTNYCTFYDANANCYRYKQIIKVIDGVAPVIQCPASPVIFCDLTPNDPLLWNASYYYDQVSGSHDLCEGPVDLNITATDLCSLSDVNIHYLLFLDLDGDGVMETVINSNTFTLPPAQQVTPGTLQFGNANSPNFTGGTNYTFDFRNVSVNQKYRFAIQTTVSGVNKSAFVRWNTVNSPTNYVIPELPYGTHKIKWFVADGCGNESVCEYQFIVRDCKPPTVTCINGLSINIMPTNPAMVQLWAIDFILYAEDNCTPRPNLKYGIRRSGTGTGFPVNSPGVTFTCADIGTQPVEIWAIDAAGNADFCETFVIVQDNLGACDPSNAQATVAGGLRTEEGAGLEEASVELSASHPTVPPITLFDWSDDQGAYSFTNAVPLGSDLTITPTKDNNPLNGVTTYDLVLISKHILGLEPLTSPYKMIAADANKSGSITTSDIVELRKLILGIYEDLPNNTSWRFVDKAFVFPNPANPFETGFPENITKTDLQQSVLEEDFVAVKIGDINQNAIANAQQAADDRTAGTLLLDVSLTPSPSPGGEGSDGMVKAGETFDVAFKTAEAAQGFQFTLNLNGLSVTEIAGGDKVSAANFGVFTNALTVSVDGADGFTVRFRAIKAGKISEMLSLSSRITKAEGYNMQSERQAIALRFHSPAGMTTVGVGFELYQNEPNPFVGHTSIGFNLPAAATATLTVYDESGRTIFTQKGDFAQGYNAILLERAVLNTSGLLYYKLETATEVATRKMMQTK